MSQSYSIGILGAGFGSRVTVPALRAEGWDVRALYSRTAERAAEIARITAIAHHTDNVDMILARDDIDAVHIATPTSTHRDLALQALEAGKHVLCEKPLAMNLDQATELRAAATRSGLTVMVNFEFRNTPERLLISRLVNDGAIGTPIFGSIDLQFRRPFANQPLDWRSRADMGGGALNEHGSHSIDALRGWFGPIESVSAQIATYEPERRDTGDATVYADADDYIAANLTFASGAVATLTTAWGSRLPTVGHVRITGTDGTVTLRSPSGIFGSGTVTLARALSDDAGPPKRDDIDEGEVLSIPPDIAQLPDPMIVAASRLLLRDFTVGISTGRSPSPNVRDGCETQAGLDAARVSARTARTVAVQRD